MSVPFDSYYSYNFISNETRYEALTAVLMRVQVFWDVELHQVCSFWYVKQSKSNSCIRGTGDEKYERKAWVMYICNVPCLPMAAVLLGLLDSEEKGIRILWKLETTQPVTQWHIPDNMNPLQTVLFSYKLGALNEEWHSSYHRMCILQSRWHLVQYFWWLFLSFLRVSWRTS